MQTSDVQTTAGSPATTCILQAVDEHVNDLSSLRRTTTERSPRLLSRRSSRKGSRQRSCSGLRAEMISPEEYEALPPSIQRKYFSPKERMLIAQQAATQMRKRKSIKGSWLAPPTPTSPVRPSTSAGTPLLSTPSLANDSKVSLIQADQSVITEDQARWFLMLPDKVRKQHFTKEEQVVLMCRCKQVLEHVSPEMAADVYRRIVNSSGTDRTPSFTKTRPLTSDDPGIGDGRSYLTFDTCSDFNPENADWEIKMLTRYSRPDPQPPPVSCTADEMMDMTSAPPPPPEPKEVTATLVDKSKRKSFMRKHSLTPLPLPAPTLAPPVPPLPSMDQVRHSALSAKQARPSTERPPDLLEPPRKHYRDQDARSKLRNAVATTEKFDEALAFGFSLTKGRNDSTSTDSSLPLQQPALYHSEEEDEDDIDAQSLGSHGPRTPTPTYTFDRQPAIKQPSFDSGIEMPYTQTVRPKTSDSQAGSTHNREMMIHMTLTRRDLRSPSPEEQLYSVQRFQNTGVDVEHVHPLALEPLRVSDDASGAHGAFAINDGVLPKGLKRVWKSLVRH